MAVKVFLGVFSALSVGVSLLLAAWGVALVVSNGWGMPSGVVLSLSAVVAVVTAGAVLGVRRVTAASGPAVPTEPHV